MSLGIVGINTGAKFSPLPKFSAATANLFRQPRKLAEICLSHCKILAQAKPSVVTFLEHFKF